MKRLKEERDESFSAGDDQFDCENGVSDVKSEKFSPETVIAEPVDDDKVDQDCKNENLEMFKVKPAENDDAPVDDRDRQADAESVCVIRSESCIGSSDSITKETLKMVKTEVENGGPSELLALSESKKLGEVVVVLKKLVDRGRMRFISCILVVLVPDVRVSLHSQEKYHSR